MASYDSDNSESLLQQESQDLFAEDELLPCSDIFTDRQDLNKEPAMGVRSILKHMAAIKKQRLVLPHKSYWNH